jgi:tRNA A-37 threonylcarbamoyl transferase component Bud32/tetratricopeptide (TPR) repeat protein/energy-coupling factor transporter ATP-binding protein EcfA2
VSPPYGLGCQTQARTRVAVTPAREKPARPQPYLPAYEIIEPLGEGGEATVYKVRAPGGQVRALKSLRPEDAQSPQAIARLDEEFRILRGLHHPSLPEVYDYGITEAGLRYIVMDLVEGVPLDEYAAEHPDTLWLLLYEIAEALTFIHDHGLLHLDLKPGNILVKHTQAFADHEQPLAVLIDFGLSYRRERGETVKLIGTTEYMAPEVIRGEADLTRAADYYSLGALLYELVEGHAPFEGATYDVLQAHLTRTPQFSQETVEQVRLYPWIEALLHKAPVERLQAFEGFRRATAEWVGEEAKGLERAWALGFLDSLDLAGKGDTWPALRAAAVTVVDAFEKSGRADDSGEATATGAGEVADPGHPGRSQRAASAAPAKRKRKSKTSVPPIDIDIEADLQAVVREKEAAARRVVDPATHARYIALSGPPGSGKSYLLRTLAADLQPRGMGVVSLADDATCAALFDSPRSTKKSTRTARKSLGERGAEAEAKIVERRIRGWNALERMAARAGVLIVADGLGALDEERRAFFEYVVQRAELAIAEGTEPRMAFVVSDESPTLKDDLATIVRRDKAIVSLDVPPPTTDDLDAVIDAFRGRMHRSEGREALRHYLEGNLETLGAIMLALRHAVAEGYLTYEGGRWDFHAPRDAQAPRTLTSADYYKRLLESLSPDARTVVTWLACHPAPLAVKDLVELAGIGGHIVLESVRDLISHRILVMLDHNEVQFISEDVRKALHTNLPSQLRMQIHMALAQSLAGASDQIELYALHCAEAGMDKDAIRAYLGAVLGAWKRHDILSVRRLCQESILHIRKNRVNRGPLYGRYIERFFVKKLVDSEWSASYYKRVITTIEDSFGFVGNVPTNFLYKYASALESSGNFDEARKVVGEGKKRAFGSKCELFSRLLLVEAALNYDTREFDRMLHCLETTSIETLDHDSLAIYYFLWMKVSDGLGRNGEESRYRELAQNEAIETQNFEYLIKIKYNTVLTHIRRMEYSEATQEIRQALRIAKKKRLHRSLCTMYFMASTVYYEGAAYDRTIKYLDKAIRVAMDIGMYDHVTSYTVRYSLSFRNLGHFDTAIRYLESTKRRLTSQNKDYFFAVLILLDIFNTIGRTLAEEAATEARTLVRSIRHGYLVALYHQLNGDYKCLNMEYDEAIAEYDLAIDGFGNLRVIDDAVRAMIAKGRCLLSMNQFDYCSTLVAEAEAKVGRFQSNEIRADLNALGLSFENVVGCPTGRRTALCEGELANRLDVRIRMRVLAALFHTYLSARDFPQARRRFQEYYSIFKMICGHLPGPEFLAEYSQGGDFAEMLKAFRGMKQENPSQDY